VTSRTLCWFSCGAASAVATKLILAENKDALPVYCETGAEHPDNERFLRDCERWFGRQIMRLRSNDYRDTWHVWEKERYLAGVKGAKCTKVLKFVPRLNFQLPSDFHVFGYTADKLDAARAARMLETYPDLKQRHPLIERQITKSAVLAIVKGAGIELPPMYALGFENNNCIPCVKSTSPAYWALIRRHFPEQFARMVRLSRDLNVRLVILHREKGTDGKSRNVRGFIDEIPASQSVRDPIVPTCDFLCQSAEDAFGAAA
jgi:hypothetical protein